MALTDETLERIAELHAGGLSVRRIAAELELSKSSVARGLSRLRAEERAFAAVVEQPASPAELSRPAEVARPAGIPVAVLAARRRRQLG